MFSWRDVYREWHNVQSTIFLCVNSSTPLLSPIKKIFPPDCLSVGGIEDNRLLFSTDLINRTILLRQKEKQFPFSQQEEGVSLLSVYRKKSSSSSSSSTVSNNFFYQEICSFLLGEETFLKAKTFLHFPWRMSVVTICNKSKLIRRPDEKMKVALLSVEKRILCQSTEKRRTFADGVLLVSTSDKSASTESFCSSTHKFSLHQ